MTDVTSDTEVIEIRLPTAQAANLRAVARLAAVEPETVAAVLLALFVITHPRVAEPGDTTV